MAVGLLTTLKIIVRGAEARGWTASMDGRQGLVFVRANIFVSPTSFEKVALSWKLLRDPDVLLARANRRLT